LRTLDAEREQGSGPLPKVVVVRRRPWLVRKATVVVRRLRYGPRPSRVRLPSGRASAHDARIVDHRVQFGNLRLAYPTLLPCDVTKAAISVPFPNRQSQPPTPCAPQARTRLTIQAGRQKRWPAGTSLL
jgi:hypothetical protein